MYLHKCFIIVKHHFITSSIFPHKRIHKTSHINLRGCYKFGAKSYFNLIIRSFRDSFTRKYITKVLSNFSPIYCRYKIFLKKDKFQNYNVNFC